MAAVCNGTMRLSAARPSQLAHARSLPQSSQLILQTSAVRSGRSSLSVTNPSKRRHATIANAAGTQGAQGDGNVKEITSREDFEQYVKEAGDKLVVLDISTRTCGPCKFIYPKVVALSLEYTDVVFLKIMGDLNESTRALMREWGVRAVPNFRFYRNGVLVHSHSGAKEEDLRSNLQLYHSQAVGV